MLPLTAPSGRARIRHLRPGATVISVQPGDHYVAMGSSFAAGPGLTPRVAGSPRRAGRSSVNYAHLFAAQHDLDLTDVSFSGATTSDLLYPDERGVPAQIDAVTERTRLVTLTAGGNDLGYLGALTISSLPKPLRMGRRARQQLAESTALDTMDERVDTLRLSLTEIVHRVQDRAPQATVVIVDYLTILPPHPSDQSDQSHPSALKREPEPEVAEWGRQAASRLSQTFQAVANDSGCVFLPVGEASRHHHAWSESPWIRQFHYSIRGGAPYHPNYDGMAAVAQFLDRLLGTEAATS